MKTSKQQYKKIGSKIKELRENNNMSQQTLAEKLGYKTDTAISLIENGDRKLSIEKLMKIADIFRVSLAVLLDQDPKHEDVITALRADQNLSEEDKRQISSFIEFIKQKDRNNDKR
ncbi:helix-turn-helix domain-containing protein [Candidatus Dojkabacteria bacterium]|nr:helix-turn-helix domain-containing protein [Candidatus Dojkabacteria bacterium]